MKSTVTFKKYFEVYVEDITAGDAMGGSAGGFSPDNPNSSDFYEPGDSRRVATDQYLYTRSGTIKRKRRKTRKKKTKHIKK